MGAQNVVELGFNVEELTAQKKQVLDLFVDMFGQLAKYDGARFNPLGDGGLADLKKSMSDGAAAMAAFGEKAKQYNDIITQQYQKQQQAKASTSDLTLAMQAHEKIVNQLAQTQAKNNASSSDAAEGLASERQALKDRNQELSTSARLQLAEDGSMQEARAQIAALTQEREKLNLTTEEGKQRLTEINGEIDKNNGFIKENSATLEKQKINIGNYAGSLGPAFEAQKDQLAAINKQLAEMELRGKSTFQNLANGQPIGFTNDRYKGNNNVTGLASGSGQNVSVLNQDAEAYQRLTLTQKILEQSLDRQTIGFRNVNQEMRSVKNTLDALDIAGLKNTEVFEQVNAAYTGAEQKIKDLHREQAILTTDAPALTAMTGVARGLGGAYALGAGAAQLFATGNEKLDKELNKLVAVMTFLQGLEAAVSALKERNAIVTALEMEASKALNFVKQIGVVLFGEETAAKTVNTASTVTNTEAVEANAEANVINTDALLATTVATEGAEAAAISFRAALASTGVGAILIAAGIAAAFLIAKIVELAGADEKAIKMQGEFAEATQKLNETISKEIELLGRSNADQINGFKDQVAIMEAAGLNQEKQFALKTKIAELEKEQADKAIASATIIAQAEQDNVTSIAFQIEKKRQISVINEQVKRGELDLFAAEDKIAKINTSNSTDQVTAANALAKSRDYHLQQYSQELIKLQELREAEQHDAKAKTAEPQKLIDHIASMEKQVAADKDAADKADALIKLGQTTTLAVETQKTAIIKFNNDEQRKIVLESANIEADYIKSKNDLVLNDDRSTFAQRLAALRSNAQQERNIAEANKDNVLTNPGSSTADRQIAIKKAAEDEQKITADSQDKQYKLTIEYADREMEAKNSITKNELESDAAGQDAITKNAQKELEERLNALKKNIDDKTGIIEADYQKDLTLAKEHGKTDEEIALLASNRQKALVDLTANTQKEIYDIAISWGEKRIKDIAEQNKATNSANVAAENYNAEEQKLNVHLAKNILSYFTYYGDKKKLDEQYAVDKTAADVKDDEERLKRLKDFQDNELQLRLNLANADLDVAESGGDKDEIAKAQAKVDALTKIQTEGLGEINAVQKKLSDDIGKNQDASANLILSKVQKTINTIRDVSMTAAQTMVGLFDAATDKQIQSLELVTARQDAATDATIAGVQRGTESQREQVEEVTILSQQKAARDSSTKKKVAEDKRAEAILDRDLAIANVIWNTEAAIAKTFGEYGGTPVGFALAGVVAALGAVEVATILSKPIPAYAEGIGIAGRGEHPGGLFVAGEAGPERITSDGKSFVVNKPTLLDAGPGLMVEPLTDAVNGLAAISMMRGFAILNTHEPKDNTQLQWDIARWQAGEMKRALKKSQQKIVNVIHVHSDPFFNPNDSLTRKLRGTKR